MMPAQPKSATNTAGFSVLGTLIALFILVTIVIATAQLSSRTERTARFTRDRFTATAITREGLELVRAIRDNNWFNDRENWVETICQNSEFTIDPDSIPIDSEPILGSADQDSQKLYVQTDGSWKHNPAAAEEFTRFRRLITVDCDCSQAGDCPRVGLDDIERDDIYITVASTVTWERAGQPDQTITVQERLWDWYRTE